jgi:hypothetical protein
VVEIIVVAWAARHRPHARGLLGLALDAREPLRDPGVGDVAVPGGLQHREHQRDLGERHVGVLDQVAGGDLAALIGEHAHRGHDVISSRAAYFATRSSTRARAAAADASVMRQ